jgi:hypothetical protein
MGNAGLIGIPRINSTMVREHSTFFGFTCAGLRDCRRQCIPLVSYRDGRDCYCGYFLFSALLLSRDACGKTRVEGVIACGGCSDWHRGILGVLRDPLR